MDYQQTKELREAARLFGGKDCHLIASIAGYSVSRGVPVSEVLRQISVSRPELFFQATKKKHERKAKSPASQDDRWRDE